MKRTPSELERYREVQRMIDESRQAEIPIGDARELTPTEIKEVWPAWADTEQLT